MNNYRAAKSGFAREAQAKLEANFPPEEAKKCLEWIEAVTGERMKTDFGTDKAQAMQCFYESLKDGMALCKLVDALSPPDSKIDFNSKTFQPAKIPAFVAARERERIGLFLNKAMEIGVPEANLFQTDYLYEKTCLVQVCACIRALGIEAQSKPHYRGPMMWPKKCEENRRNFSEEQLKAGQQVISLQYGTNKGASQAGINMGKRRMIMQE
ncbi:myophilin-like [Liolophura sinensis]|uniref:myophilin-like n=1 Tax=Liolophura sinensis TaxID=3198878 RepID=UPI003158303B